MRFEKDIAKDGGEGGGGGGARLCKNTFTMHRARPEWLLSHNLTRANTCFGR